MKKECTLDDGFFYPCDTLNKTIQDTRGKGVYYLNLTNIKTGKLVRSAACLKSGEFTKRGILLNFCPFCGKPILNLSYWRKNDE